MNCTYAKRSEKAYIVEDDNTLTPTEGPVLCSWAMDSAPEKLVDTPRWLQRNALAGHLLRHPEDCEGCPCFTEARS